MCLNIYFYFSTRILSEGKLMYVYFIKYICTIILWWKKIKYIINALQTQRLNVTFYTQSAISLVDVQCIGMANISIIITPYVTTSSVH